MRSIKTLFMGNLAMVIGFLSAAFAHGQEPTTYIVQSGDTPCEIAEFFRVPCADLTGANQLGAEPVIYPGQILNIPLISKPKTQAVAQTSAPKGDSQQTGSDADGDNADKSAVQTVDLLAVYSLAITSDPVYAAQHYRYTAAAQIVPQSKASLRPQLAASSSYTEASSDGVDASSASISLSQALYDRGSRLAVKQADQQTEQAELEFEIAAEALITRAVSAYLSVLTTYDNVELSRRNQRAIGRQLELAEERLEVGLGTRTDLFDARARFENAVADTIEAEKQRDDARQGLISLVGEDVGQLQPLSDSAALGLPQPDDAEQWVARALRGNRALKTKSLGISLASLEISRQKAQRLPHVGLTVSGNYSDTVVGDDTSARITFSVNMPFYQGGLINARVREAAENRNAAQSDYEAAFRDVRRDTRQTFLGIKSRLRRLDALAEAVRAGENALLAKEESFAAGLTTNIAVLDAQRDLFQAERDYLKERYEYILQMLELERLSGDLDEDDVRRVNTWLNTN